MVVRGSQPGDECGAAVGRLSYTGFLFVTEIKILTYRVWYADWQRGLGKNIHVAAGRGL